MGRFLPYVLENGVGDERFLGPTPCKTLGGTDHRKEESIDEDTQRIHPGKVTIRSSKVGSEKNSTRMNVKCETDR